MEKFNIKTNDLYYTNRRLKSLGAVVSTQNKTVSLTETQYNALKRKDKKKIENLTRAGHNVQISLL